MPEDSFSLVIPTYNEAANIRPLLQRTIEALESTGRDFEIIIADDDSPDGTWRLARETAGDDERIKVLRRRESPGLAPAVVDGWRMAQGGLLGVMDGDLQHPPELLGALLEALGRGGADVAVASRYAPGGTVVDFHPWRRYLSSGATALARLAIPPGPGRIRDPMSGYFVLRAEVVDLRALDPLGYKILLEVLARGRYAGVVEVPYTFHDRRAGSSKIGMRQCWDYLRHLRRLRAKRPAPPAGV